MILQTERLILRPYRLADASAVHAYGSDPEVCRYTEFGPNTWDDTLGFLQTASDTAQANIDLAITLREVGEVIGGIGARPNPGGRHEMGWVLRRDMWGHGIVTEAARVLLAHVSALPGATAVFARCRPQNVASMRIMEKIGMVFVERIDREKEFRGEWVDTLVYELRVPLVVSVPA
jgi:ribosomal-protein-alanine N-acetyltransferase